jgi:Fe-S cluster biogenesis protein NfuA/nitrite reductase/ring-hydroxylating ferredoxin subunit
MISAERPEPLELVGEVERRLGELETLPDPAVQEKAMGAVQALFELYGAGLERIVDVVSAREEAPELARAFAEDELVAHLLILHGLHPIPVEDRVLEALDEVRPYLESHGGNVELLGVEGGIAQLRLAGSCSGCPSSTMTLKLAIEKAIHKAAPEIEEVIAEDAAVVPQSPLLQIEVTPAAVDSPPALDSSWTMAGGLPELAAGAVVLRPVAGTPLLFLKLSGRAYAYRARCPSCEHSLDGAELHGVELSCPGCGNRYDALRAGRGVDLPQLHLEPVPLLEDEDGLVRVALPVAA